MNPFANWTKADVDSFNAKVSGAGSGNANTRAAKQRLPQPAPSFHVSYNREIVSAFFHEELLPQPQFEFQFHPERKWRFDLAWPDYRLALEVQGGIFAQGRHNRGAAMLKEWEKLNAAAAMGFRVLFCQPQDLCTRATAQMIFSAIHWQKK